MQKTVVHILTKGFASPNGIAFLFPLHFCQRRLRDLHIDCRYFGTVCRELSQCDVLVIDSRFYSSSWAQEMNAVLEEIHCLSSQVNALLYFDISDSTGWLQTQVLPYVDRYYKSQLLKERENYLEPIYGNRIYADFYHRNWDVVDSEPVLSRPIKSLEGLQKLRVSWNSGLANYSLWGPMLSGLRNRISADFLLRFPNRFVSARNERPIPIACRFGITYPRNTVACQRSRIRKMMEGKVASGKLKRRAYMAEMERCQIVISPFGYGEITLKDFEAFMSGAMVLKPEMSHMETWPNLFVGEKTVKYHSWDLTNLHDVLEEMLQDKISRLEIAEQGQESYRHYIATTAGYNEFALRFRRILDEVLADVV